MSGDFLGDGFPCRGNGFFTAAVGGLFALKAHYVDGESPEKAIEIGKSAGMTRIEPQVRAVLGL